MTGPRRSQIIQDALVDLQRVTQQLSEAAAERPRGEAGRSPLELAEQLLRERRMRERYFPARTFGEPGWDMLLALFVAHEKDERLKLSAAAAAAAVPGATADATVSRLVDANLVSRTKDAAGRREVQVELTAEGAEVMRHYLLELIG